MEYARDHVDRQIDKVDLTKIPGFDFTAAQKRSKNNNLTRMRQKIKKRQKIKNKKTSNLYLNLQGCLTEAHP